MEYCPPNSIISMPQNYYSNRNKFPCQRLVNCDGRRPTIGNKFGKAQFDWKPSVLNDALAHSKPIIPRSLRPLSQSQADLFGPQTAKPRHGG